MPLSIGTRLGPYEVVGPLGAGGQASPPQALFRARMRAPGVVSIRNDYAVRADGQRFLINKLVEDPAKATITVTLNWASRLER